MNTFSKSLLASLVLASVSPVSVAQETLNPVVVTASRTAQTVDEALAPVIVISRDEIERAQATDVAELLRFHAGFDIGRNGNPGSTTSLFIRGTESNHTLVMIDGVKINPGTIGGAAFQNINPEIIERIEIVKGPRSALYGSEAIGGVINIITRRAQSGTTLNTVVGFGADQARRFSAGLTHGAAKWRAGFQVNSDQTDGFPSIVTSTVDRGFKNTSINAFAGIKIGSHSDLELSHWQSRGNSEYLSFGSLKDQDFVNRATALTFKTSPTDSWSSTVKLSQIEDEIRQGQGSDFVQTERNVLDWQNDIEVNQHHLVSAGISLSRENAESLSFGTSFDVDTDTDAIFLQDNISYGAHQLLLAARHTNHSTFGNYNTWNIEYGYQLSPKTRLLAGVGTAFRAPDSTDRFGFGGDPDLKPEESRNIELGLRYAPNKHQRYVVSLFDNKIDNLIDLNSSFTKNINIGEARIRGIEASWQYNAKPWDIRVEAISQDPENRDNGDLLSRRAKRTLTVALGYSRNKYRIGVDVLTTSSRDNSSFDTNTLDSYTLVNLTGTYHVSKELTLNAKVKNLFDEEYALAITSGTDYSVQDRAAFFELRYTTNQ